MSLNVLESQRTSLAFFTYYCDHHTYIIHLPTPPILTRIVPLHFSRKGPDNLRINTRSFGLSRNPNRQKALQTWDLLYAIPPIIGHYEVAQTSSNANTFVRMF